MMAFTPETGSGLEDANAYIDVAFFDAHHADRGRDVTTITTVIKETAIVRATDYIDKRFGRKFRGFRQSKRQGLEWPRLDAFDDDDYALNSIDDIPRQLEKACAEYAVRAIQYATELAPDPPRPAAIQDLSDVSDIPTADVNVITGQVRASTERVEGAVTDSKEYATSASLQARLRDKAIMSSLVSGVSIPEYPEADLWIEELLAPPVSRRLMRGG